MRAPRLRRQPSGLLIWRRYLEIRVQDPVRRLGCEVLVVDVTGSITGEGHGHLGMRVAEPQTK